MQKIMTKPPTNKIKQNDQIYALKVRTESNGLGVLKTLVVLLLIVLQLAFLICSYLFFINVFHWYFLISISLTAIACIHALSSNYHGQAKATWVLFLLATFGFGYFFYFMSDKRVLFARKRKQINNILVDATKNIKQNKLPEKLSPEVLSTCNYLFNTGKFASFDNSKTTYYPSGTKLFDEILAEMKQAKNFIFIEFFIVSNGVLLKRMLDVLKDRVANGVEVKIIYDDMGSHHTISRKIKNEILNAGIELRSFNRLVPVFNLSLNLRNHRKIVVIDGDVSFTGGANLADEYINEKRMHGYWKDSGVKLEGPATDSFSLAFLTKWKFLTAKEIDFNKYLNKCQGIESSGIITPFVTGPNYESSIAQNIVLSQISNAYKKLYIMTPYFIPDETIMNTLICKAKAGVDVNIILPDVADKKYVYIVSRNNAEKLIQHGVKIFTMKHSFVHSKIIMNENSAVIGSINIDLRSFYQQFESAIFTNESHTLLSIEKDFAFTISKSTQITESNSKRRNIIFRLLAGVMNLISPFM